MTEIFLLTKIILLANLNVRYVVYVSAVHIYGSYLNIWGEREVT